VTTSRSSGEIAEQTALTYTVVLTFEELLEPHPAHRTTADSSATAARREATCTVGSLSSVARTGRQRTPAAAAIAAYAAAGSEDPNTAEPVTSRFAPASTQGPAVTS
jgi:hypothetical protein